MGNLENPITLFRKRHNLTQKELAREINLSTTQLHKIEQGTYEVLPESLQTLTGIDDATYQRFRSMKRRQAELNCQLDRFITPSEFRLWRHKIAWEKFLPPTQSAFAGLLCINVNYLQRFESGPETGQLCPSLAVALKECGVTFYEQLELDLTGDSIASV